MVLRFISVAPRSRFGVMVLRLVLMLLWCPRLCVILGFMPIEQVFCVLFPLCRRLRLKSLNRWSNCVHFGMGIKLQFI